MKATRRSSRPEEGQTATRYDPRRMIVISIGCPASVGPEVSLAAVRRLQDAGCVLVGSALAIRQAAELVRVPMRRLEPYAGQVLRPGRLYILDVGPELAARDLDPRRPTRASGCRSLRGS